jgi:hypothetical protein
MVGTSLASLAPLAGCGGGATPLRPTDPPKQPPTTPPGTESNKPLGTLPEVLSPGGGQMRLDFIGLVTFITEAAAPEKWLDAALVRADKAPGLSAHQHIPTLRIARTAYDEANSTFPFATVDQDFVNFRVDDMKIELKTLDAGGNRVDPKDPFHLGRFGGVKYEGDPGCPKSAEYPEDRDPWTDFDWVLAGTEIYPKLRALPDRWKNFAYVTTHVHLTAGRIEYDENLKRDSPRPMYRWIVPTSNKERALKETVRYLVTGDTPVIDIVLTKSTGGTFYIRCKLDAESMGGGKHGAYAQLVYMPAAGMSDPKRRLGDVRTMYWLADEADGTRPADLSKCEVPTTTGIKDPVTAYCDTGSTSDCGCCPPMSLVV